MRKDNPNVNICSRKGVTLVELVVSMTLVALFSVVCVSLINPIERIYQHTVKLSHAQLIADTVVDSIRKECTDVDNSDEGSVWIAKGSANGTDSDLYNGPVSSVYVDPDKSGSVLVMRKNGNYCEAIFSCFKITEENITAVEKTGMTGTSFSHAAKSLSDENNKANLNSGYVHFGYYQAIDNSKGVTPDKNKIYDYTNPITASTYEGYTVSLSFEKLQYKEDENHVKHPTFVECVVNVYEGDYTKPESKRIYTRSTVISFSPNGSGKGTNAGGGGGTSATKNGTVTVKWVDSAGKAIAWPSTIPSVDVTLWDDTNQLLTRTVTENPGKFGYSLTVSGKLNATSTNLETSGYKYKVTGKPNGGFIVTYKHIEDPGVKLVSGTYIQNTLGTNVTGVIFGKYDDYKHLLMGVSSKDFAVDINATNDDSRKSDYRYYRVGSTAYILSDDGTFVANENCKSMFNNFQKLSSITWPDGEGSFDTRLTTDMSFMFYNCKAMTQFVLPKNFVKSSCRTLESMFENCSGATFIKFDEWDTSGVKSMKKTFFGCSSMETFNIPSHFVQGACEDIESMFEACTHAGSIKPNNWDTSGVITMNRLFCNYGIQRDSNTRITIDISCFSFKSCKIASKIFCRDPNKIKNGTSLISKAVFPSETHTTAIQNMVAMFSACENITEIENFEKLNMTSVKDVEHIFYHCYLLGSNNTTGEIDFSGVYLDSCTNLKGAFEGCTSLKVLKMHKGSLSACKGIPANAFLGCNNLTTIDFDEVNFSACTSFDNLSGNCQKLDNVYVKNSTLIGLQNLGFAKNYKHVNLSGSTFAMTSLEKSLQGAAKLETFDFSSVKLTNCTTMKMMFSGCTKLKKVVLDDLVANKVTNCSRLFENCVQLGTDDNGSFALGADLPINETTERMFSGCTGLNSVTVLSKMPLCKRTIAMFIDCHNLKKVDLSKFIAGALTNCECMFENCYNLSVSAGDLSGLNTSNTTNFARMFYNCCYNVDGNISPNSTTINISSLNFIKAQYFDWMFCCDDPGNDLLTTIVLPEGDNGNASNVIHTYAMFKNRQSVTEITHLSDFKTGTKLKTGNIKLLDVTYNNEAASEMFYRVGVSTLDLSGFDFKNLKSAANKMFWGCTELETIYVSPSSVYTTVPFWQPSELFFGCGKLVGKGDGAPDCAYADHGDDADYARVNQSGYPGYFTKKE